MSEIKPLDSQTRQHCKVTDFSVCRQNDNNHRKPSSKSVKQSKNSLKRRLTCPNLATNSVPQRALQSYLTYGQQRMNRSKQESVTVDNYSWSNKSKLSLSHVPIVECRNGESPIESDSDVLYARIKESHFGESYKEIVSATNCENEQSETDSEVEDNNGGVYVSGTDKKEDLSIKGSSSMATDNKNVVEINSETLNTVSTACDTKSANSSESNEKLEDKKSEEERSTKATDLLDYQNTTMCTAKDTTDSALKENTHSKREVINLSKVTEAEENPSISDLDEETDDDKTGVVSLSNSVKSSSVLKVNDMKERGTVQETNIEDKKLSKDEIMEHEKDFKNDKVNSVAISDTSIEASSDVGKTGMVLSNSSSDVAKSRFYDGLSDAETKTLKNGPGHTVHRHTVDVHINNADHSSGTDEHDTKTSELSDNNVVYKVRNDSEKLSSCEGDGNNCKEKNERDALKEDNVFPKAPTGVNESVNIMIKQKGDNAITDLPGEKTHSSKDESMKAQTYNNDDRKGNIDRDKAFVETSKYESEIETEDECVTISEIEPCINCLDLISNQPDQKGIGRCSHCIAKFNKRKMFGDHGNDQEVINFEGKLRDRYVSCMHHLFLGMWPGTLNI